MNTERDMKWAMGWNEMNLSLMGVWPHPVISRSVERTSKYRFVFSSFFIGAFLWGPQTINFFILWGDISLMTENLTMANMSITVALLKLIFLGYHKEAFRPLLASFMKDWRNLKSEADRNIMMKNAFVSRLISIGCTILSQIVITSFFVLRMIAITTLDREEIHPSRPALYPGFFLYDIRKSPVFELNIAGQMVGAYCCTIAATAIDSFVSLLLLHNCSEFAKLRRSVEDLFDWTEEKSYEEFHEAVANIVKRHEHLNGCARTIQECFNVLLLVEMLASSVEICFQGYQAFGLLTSSQGGLSILEMFLVLVHISHVLVNLCLYCFLGEMLIVQSSGMGISAYNSKWYNAPPKVGKDLTIIMLRSTIPLRLTAGKFGTFSFEMLSSIIKTSLGYLSVLITVVGHTD